jgi:hypothetical protein
MNRRFSKLQVKKEDEQSFKELFFESLNEYTLRLFIYTGLSLAVYFIGTFSWWIGFVLFIILTVLMLSESLLIAFFAFLEIFIAFLMFSIINKFKNKNFDTGDFFSYGLGLAALSGLFSLFLLVLFYYLLVFFFPSSRLI